MTFCTLFKNSMVPENKKSEYVKGKLYETVLIILTHMIYLFAFVSAVSIAVKPTTNIQVRKTLSGKYLKNQSKVCFPVF